MADQIIIGMDLGSHKIESELKGLYNTLKSADMEVENLIQSFKKVGSATKDASKQVKSYFDLFNQKLKQTQSLYARLNTNIIDGRRAVSSYFDLFSQKLSETASLYARLNTLITDGRSTVSSYFSIMSQKLSETSSLYARLNATISDGRSVTNSYFSLFNQRSAQAISSVKSFGSAIQDGRSYVSSYFDLLNQKIKEGSQGMQMVKRTFSSAMNATIKDGTKYTTKLAASFDLINQKAAATRGIFSKLKSEFSSLGSISSILSNTMRSLFASMQQMFNSIPRGIINVAKLQGEFLGFRNALGVAEGSIGAANRSLQTAIDIAVQLKLPIKIVTKEYSKFMNAVRLVGFSTEEAVTHFKNLSEAARVLNLSQEQTSGMFMALEQMISKGTVSMEELRRQLGNALPGAVDIAALSFQDKLPKALKTTTKKVSAFIQLVREGKVESKGFFNSFTPFLKKRTKPFLGKALETFVSELEALNNQFVLFKIKLGDIISTVINPFIKGLTWLLEVINDLIGVNEQWVAKQNSVSASIRETNDEVDKIKNTYTDLEATTTKVAGATSGLGIAMLGLTGVVATLRAAFIGLKSAALFAITPIAGMIKSIPLWGTAIGLAALRVKELTSAFIALIVANPIVAIFAAAVAAIAGLVTWLESAQRKADAADRSFQQFTATLKNNGAAAETAGQKLSSLIDAMSGIERLGAEYVMTFHSINNLIKRQGELNAIISSTERILKNPAIIANTQAYNAHTKLLKKYKAELKEIPNKIANLKEEQGKFRGALIATGNATDKATESNKKLKTSMKEIKDPFDDVVKGLTDQLHKLVLNEREFQIYSLQMKGLTQDQISYAMSLWDTNKALEAQINSNKQANEKVIEGPNLAQFEFDPTPMEDYYSDLKDNMYDYESVYVNAFKNMEDAMVSMMTTGKASFADMAKAILADLARLIAKQIIFNALSSAMGGMFGGVSAGTSAYASSAGAFSPGIGGFTARGLATGTNYVPRDMVANLHKGEAVVPAKYNPNNPQNGSIDNTSNININMTINGVTDAESFKRNEMQIANGLQQQLAIANRNL